ncbi:MAG TPA: hypothetical protein DDZ41_08460 [Flavobacterium sp.]|nr:hypothetical protein [Flavobacterium sp.]
MKRLVIVIFLIYFYETSNAQINEIGLFVGGTNYVGDVGKTNYIDPNELAFGIIYKWNKSVRHSFRFSYMQGKIKGNDASSSVPSRYKRNFSFTNSVKEISAGIEFNFFSFDLHQFDMQYTPYVFTGINYFWHTNFETKDFKTEKDFNPQQAVSIPIILGFKARVTNALVIGIEAGARYTFSDNIDGSNSSNDKYKDIRFGNLNSNDWYMFTGATITYTFGENPCFCPN